MRLQLLLVVTTSAVSSYTNTLKQILSVRNNWQQSDFMLQKLRVVFYITAAHSKVDYLAEELVLFILQLTVAASSTLLLNATFKIDSLSKK